MLRRRPVLLLQLRRTRRILPFQKKLDPDRLRNLLLGAKQMGYDVDLASVDSLPESSQLKELF